ncbi:MAG: tRNA-guanine transglycosylase DpdA [Roseiflexus sp.]|nr:tRNA-guanine transglycosylase DpdA [Roseiflexus sp.]
MSLIYFIPDWDDRVDPNYDFINDTHSPDRDPYHSDYYAHQIYNEPPYDGILVSRAVIDRQPSKLELIRDIGSIKRYLRLPESHTVLGDCGAFSYWREENPPYKNEEMLEFYQRLGFDFGVSVDHLIFAGLDHDKERRWNITMENAEVFIKRHRAGRYTFTPIGVVQGWDPESYRRGARQLIKMGYRYIAIGGLVRSATKDIIQILSAIQEELPPGIRVHLFGVNRPEYVHVFAQLGVTSFDSASRLRRAWIDGERNYFLGDDAYTAIRVPYSSKMTGKSPSNEKELQKMEKDALTRLRDYDRGIVSINQVFESIVAYTELSGKMSSRMRREYWRTLQEEPWKRCPCAICRSIGVEVIIFRGNNRNRRRGFHNTWQLYQNIKSNSASAPSCDLTRYEALLAPPQPLPPPSPDTRRAAPPRGEADGRG